MLDLLLATELTAREWGPLARALLFALVTFGATLLASALHARAERTRAPRLHAYGRAACVAAADGIVTREERAILDALARHLRLARREIAALERVAFARATLIAP